MMLKVLATRDDGVQLIGDEDLECALLASPDGAVVTSVAAAAARGNWEWADQPVAVMIPENAEAKVRQASAEFTANLAAKQPVSSLTFTASAG
jgi:hypothetical protein